MIRSSEQVFFRSTRQELEVALGLSNIAELGGKSEVRLPTEIHLPTVRAIEYTVRDHRERWIDFGVRNNRPSLERQGIGEEFDVDRGEAIAYKDAFIEDIYKTYLAKPMLALFHTHPSFSVNFLKSKGMYSAQTQYGSLTVPEISTYLNMLTPNFSHSDLSFIEGHARYVRSMLLGSKQGYRWIINPNFKMPVLDNSARAKKYGEGYEELCDAYVKRVIWSGMQSINQTLFQKEADSLLLEFCSNRGLLAFGNNNFSIPVLKKLG